MQDQSMGATETRHPRVNRLLLSGASGLIGTSLVRTLKDDRIAFVRLRRKESGEPAESAGEVTVAWDPNSPNHLPNLSQIGTIDAAVHLSGVNVAGHRWTKQYKQEIIDSRLKSTQALSLLLTRLDPPPAVLVCASAIGIYGNRGDELLSEDAPPGDGFLAEACVAWEAATRVAEAVGVRVVHARFGVVLSPQGGALEKLLPLFRLGLGGKLGNGRQWMPWISLRDTIGAIRHCLVSDDLAGAVNVVSPHPVTNAVFTRSLGHALHRPAILPAPAFALRLLVGQMADEALLGGARVVPAKLLRSGYRFADPEIGPTLETLLSA